jgi:hypothetical protein
VNIAPAGKAGAKVSRWRKPAESQRGIREWMEEEKIDGTRGVEVNFALKTIPSMKGG